MISGAVAHVIVTNNTKDRNFEEKTELKSSSYPNNRGEIETIKSIYLLLWKMGDRLT